MAELLLKSVPFVLEFLDIDNEDIVQSGILDDGDYDDDMIAVISQAMSDRTQNESSLNQKSNKNSFGVQIYKSCSGENFRSFYRMKRETLAPLLSFLDGGQTDWKPGNLHPGRPEIPSEMRLHITLHYLGSRKTMRQLAKIYHVCESSILNAIRKTVSSIYQSMQYFIKWPDGTKQLEIADGFLKTTGMPRVVGVINVCHIQVRAPNGQKDYYKNPQGKLSIILQAVCDHEYKFLHCCTGWPGFLDDASVFHDSDLYMDVTKDQAKFFPIGHYLVADSTYPLQDWLLTPFDEDVGEFNDEQIKFNQKHKVTKEIIQTAMEHLKGRFPRLQYIDMVEMEDIVKVILVCCALHNFCHTSGDVEVFSENDGNENEETDSVSESDVTSQKEDGVDRRYEIANILSGQQTKKSEVIKIDFKLI